MSAIRGTADYFEPRPDSLGCASDRDRGTPRGGAPPTPPSIRVTYHGGSIGLSFQLRHRGGGARVYRTQDTPEPPPIIYRVPQHESAARAYLACVKLHICVHDTVCKGVKRWIFQAIHFGQWLLFPVIRRWRHGEQNYNFVVLIVVCDDISASMSVYSIWKMGNR